MKITCLAFAGKWGGFGASGFSAPSSAARPSVASSCEMTAGIRIEPLKSERTIWRREQFGWSINVLYEWMMVHGLDGSLRIFTDRSVGIRNDPSNPCTISSIHIQKLIAAHDHAQITRQRLPIQLVRRRISGHQLLPDLQQIFLRLTNLFRSGRAPISQPESVINSLTNTIVSHSDAHSELFRLVVHKGAVHQEQRLNGRNALRAVVGGRVRVSAVEDLEERVLFQPLLHQINAAAIGVVDGEKLHVLREAPCLLGRERMLAAHRAIERAADREDRVADLFRFEPSAIEPPQVIVPYIYCGVRRSALCVIITGKLISMREHHQLVHLFD